MKIEKMKNDTDYENIEEDEKMNIKPKWSLKKKLILGGGVLAGLVLGAIVLGNKKATNAEEGYNFEEDSEDEMDIYDNSTEENQVEE